LRFSHDFSPAPSVYKSRGSVFPADKGEEEKEPKPVFLLISADFRPVADSGRVHVHTEPTRAPSGSL